MQSQTFNNGSSLTVEKLDRAFPADLDKAMVIVIPEDTREPMVFYNGIKEVCMESYLNRYPEEILSMMVRDYITQKPSDSE